MKFRRALLLVLATIMLFSCSCQHTPGNTSAESEPQYMAFHLSDASRLGNDIYFVGGVSFNKAQIFAAEYGSENFEPFIPCFDTVCNHNDRLHCCLATENLTAHADKLAAFLHNGELSLLIFNPVDVCFSKPYSNVKLNLVWEDYINDLESLLDDPYTLLDVLTSRAGRSNPFVYGDYFYYSEIKNGARTQYRISLTGGKPERVFEEDGIIVRTIINGRFYGIRYEANASDPERPEMKFFRSDMNYENVEELPEMLELFEVPGDGNLNLRRTVILDADGDSIYVLHDKTVWKLPDSDVNSEPVPILDMGDKFPSDLTQSSDSIWYDSGIMYIALNTGRYSRDDLLNDQGYPTSPTQWYERSILYSFDTVTGECKELDIASQNYLIATILYADDKYVYGKGIYVHDDNRSIQGVTMRLTLDTMKYEVLLPDYFRDYSAPMESE